MLGAQVEKERIMQEVAVLVDRSDIQRGTGPAESAREAFLRLARPGRRGGQEAGFSAARNEPRSQYAAVKNLGPGGEALKITEMGLLMKSEIEKSREQVQNLE